MRKFVFGIAATLTALTASAQVNSPADDGYCRRGILMYQDKNYVGCIDQMQYLKSQQPTAEQLEQADYYVALSSAHLGKGDAEGLLRHFLWRHPASQRCLTIRLALGNLLMDRGKYSEALAEYNLISDDALDNEMGAELRFNRAYCLLKRGDYAAARGVYASLTRDKTFGNASRFYLAYIKYIDKDYREAESLFKTVDTATAPGNMADYYLTQIYYINRDYAKAASKARTIADRNVDPEFSIEACRIAGESLYEMGDDAAAIPYLRRYVDAVKEPLPSSLYILGVADYRNGNYREAIDRLSPVASLDNAMGQSANLFIGQAFMQQGNYSSAMFAFDKALKMEFDPEVRETAFYNYAVANTQGGKIPFGGSVAVFEDFLRSYPNSRFAPQIREYIVTGYMTDNNYPAALASINAIKNPSTSILKAKQQVLYTLGSRELAAGNTKAAVGHLTEAASLASHNLKVGAETKLWLGEALYADGQLDKAAAQLNSYLNDKNMSAENKPLALYDLGYTRFSQERYGDAATDFSRFISDPGKMNDATIADAYNRLADCYYYDSKFADATAAYDKAYRRNPSAGDYPLYQKAMMEGLNRKYPAKIEGLKDMIAKFPTSTLVPQALIEIGESYDLSGLPEQAIESYSMVSARYPSSPQGRQASLLLALTYLNNGDRSLAIDTYKQLITDFPTSDEARMASDNLKSILAEDNALDDYEAFVANVPQVGSLDDSEAEALTFTAAEREYIDKGTTGRLNLYLEKFPNGASRPAALAYLVEASANAGDLRSADKRLKELEADYPDAPALPQALLNAADARYNATRYADALNAYISASGKTDNTSLANNARLGILRSASKLGKFDTAIQAADALTATSTIPHDQRSEAVYLRGRAFAETGNEDKAAADWQSLADDLNDIYGTMSAYALAEQQLRLGNLDKAQTLTDALIDSDSPYDYWFARSIILLSDIYRAQGNNYEAEAYLTNLRDKYPGTESDIFDMIDARLGKK